MKDEGDFLSSAYCKTAGEFLNIQGMQQHLLVKNREKVRNCVVINVGQSGRGCICDSRPSEQCRHLMSKVLSAPYEFSTATL